VGPARTSQPPGPAVLRHAFYFRLAVVNPPAAEPATNYCAAAVCSGDSNYSQQRVAAKAARHQRTAKTLTTPLSQAAEMPPAVSCFFYIPEKPALLFQQTPESEVCPTCPI
ncbi:hypothetical protein CMEL01_08543, partial [Colletotrichum melonis]